MASRSSTRSPKTTMSSPSDKARSTSPRQGASAANQRQGVKGPSEKKHKNMGEVRATGRQSDRGGGTKGSRGA